MQNNFRLGATSYVFETDLVGNARRLANLVDDMELVLFETKQHGSNFPTRDTIASLNEIAAQSGLTYTVHLPQDVNLDNAMWRDQNHRVIDMTRDLNPYAYVMHLDGRPVEQYITPAQLAQWQQNARRALQEIIALVGDSVRVCVENIETWNPAYFADMVEDLRTSRCVDVGHLWLNECDPQPELVTHMPRTRVIHLHGIHERDHASLAHIPDARLLPVIRTLSQENFAGVLTLEVFGESDFFTSRAAVLRAMEQIP